jgi:hypothetical protein
VPCRQAAARGSSRLAGMVATAAASVASGWWQRATICLARDLGRELGWRRCCGKRKYRRLATDASPAPWRPAAATSGRLQWDEVQGQWSAGSFCLLQSPSLFCLILSSFCSDGGGWPRQASRPQGRARIRRGKLGRWLLLGCLLLSSFFLMWLTFIPLCRGNA